MIYLQRNRKGNFKFYIWAIVIALVLYWIASSVLISNSISGFFVNLARPITSVEKNVGEFFSEMSVVFKSKTDLQNENDSLKTELETRDLDILNSNLIKIENEELREMLNRTDSGRYVSSLILARPTSVPYDTLLIDQGEKSGISLGNKVFYNDVLIGKIDSVFSESSKVLLFSSPGNEFDVKIGSSPSLTKATARGGGNFVARVPKGFEVKEGDSVEIPEVSSRVFAVVEKVQSDPSDTFTTVYFKNPLNIFEIKWVEVKTTDK